MEKGLFRQKSVDHISSPEELHDYMHVTSPKLWMLLAAILILLIGFVVYAVSTTMESSMPLKVRVEYGAIDTLIPASSLDLIKMHMPVRVAGKQGEITDIFQSTYLNLELRLDDGAPLADGMYTLVLENGEDLPEEPDDEGNYTILATVWNGAVTTYYDSPERKKALETDHRFRIRETGRLGTITNASLYDCAYLFITLENGEKLTEDGFYDAEIVTERTTPISFLLN